MCDHRVEKLYLRINFDLFGRFDGEEERYVNVGECGCTQRLAAREVEEQHLPQDYQDARVRKHIFSSTAHVTCEN